MQVLNQIKKSEKNNLSKLNDHWSTLDAIIGLRSQSEPSILQRAQILWRFATPKTRGFLFDMDSTALAIKVWMKWPQPMVVVNK